MILNNDAQALGFQTELPITGEFYQPPTEKLRPGFWKAAESAFALHNPIASTLKYSSYMDWEYKEDLEELAFDPFDKEKYDITGYELESRAFASTQTPEQADQVKSMIDEQRRIRDVVEQDGWRGFGLSMAAGILSPENLLPINAAVNSYRAGENILTGASRVGMAGGISVALAEGPLQLTQPTRTAEESAFAIAGGTFLSGILGGIATGLSKASFNKIATKLEGEDLVVGSGSVGAMKAGLTKEELLTKPAVGRTVRDKDGKIIKNADAFKVVKFGPGARMEFSPLASANEWGRMIESTPTRIMGNVEGKASPEAVENAVKLWDGLYGDSLMKSSELYHQYRTGVADAGLGRRMARSAVDVFRPGREFMTKREFDEAVGNAMSRGDVSDIPEVQAAARHWRKEFYDPVMVASKEAGLLPDDFKFDSPTAASYVNRVYDVQKIKDLRHGDGGFEYTLVQWLREGGSRAEELDRMAKLAKKVSKEVDEKTLKLDTEEKLLTWLKKNGISEEDLIELLPKKDRVKVSREQAALNAIRTKIEKLEASEAKLKKMDDAELYEIASDITDKILREPGGATTFSNRKSMGKASAFHARALLIPDEKIMNFMVRDIEFLAGITRRRVVPEIEMARAFDGDINMTTWIDKVKSEAKQQIMAAKTKKERQYWEDAKTQAITDAEAMRDRLLNVYEKPSDPTGFIPRASLMLRQFAFLTHMGQMMVSSIPDVGKIIFGEGLGNFGKSMKGMIHNKAAFRMRMREKRGWGVGADMALHTRAASFAEIGDEYGHLSKFERGVKGATEKFGFVTLMDAWNSSLKQISGVIVEDRIADAARAWAKGTISKTDIEKLAASGIDKAKAQRIAAFIQKHGEEMDGVRFTRTDLWEDAALARTFKQAVARDVDNIIVTRGVGDVPLWGSKELGKHVIQFKSFGAATVRRTLQLGLQQRDMATLNGVLIMMALGSATYAMKAQLAGRDIETEPGALMLEGLDHSGILGMIWEVPMMANRTLGGALFDTSLSRYRTRPQLGALFGPAFGMGERFTGIAIGGLRGDVSDANVHAARRLLPYNNLFYMRWLFDHFEGRVK